MQKGDNYSTKSKIVAETFSLSQLVQMKTVWDK